MCENLLRLDEAVDTSFYPKNFSMTSVGKSTKNSPWSEQAEDSSSKTGAVGNRHLRIEKEPGEVFVEGNARFFREHVLKKAFVFGFPNLFVNVTKIQKHIWICIEIFDDV